MRDVALRFGVDEATAAIWLLIARAAGPHHPDLRVRRAVGPNRPDTTWVVVRVEALSARDPLVLGRYRLLGRLGAGGMGRVYLGRGPSGELVAVKMMHTRIADDPGFRSRFATEVALARKVESPGVARLVEADPDAPLPWLAMEYLPAPALETVVAAVGPAEESSLGVLAWRLAEACADLHAARVAHRDLKPSNVLLAADRPKLIDFGIARAVDATSATQTGVVLGPPGYMSPEQALGEDPGLASDVFSLAGVLTYAATGRAPFGAASNAVAMMRRIVDDEPELSGAPGWLRQVLEPCFAKDPDARPAAAELAGRLSPHGTGPWPPEAVRHLVAGPEPSAAAPIQPAVKPLTRRAMVTRLGLSALGLVGAAAAANEIIQQGSPVRWYTRIDDPAFHSLLVTDDALYGTTFTSVYAIDPESGHVRWRAKLNDGTAPTLGVAGTALCVCVPRRLVVLDPATGRTAWEYEFESRPGPPQSETAATNRTTVFAAARDQVVALDGTLGTVRWIQQTTGWASAVRGIGAGCLLVTESQMCALDGSTGRLLWRLPLEPTVERIRPEDVIVGAGIAVAVISRRLIGVDVRTGLRLWEAEVGGAGPAARTATRMIVSGETIAILGADGRVRAFDLQTGSRSWAYPTVRGPDLTSIATDGRSVFANGDADRTYALDLTTGAPHLPQNSDDHPWASDLLGARNGVLFTTTLGGMQAVQVGRA